MNSRYVCRARYWYTTQRGFSLVEMGVALVVLGLLVTTAFTFWRLNAQQTVVRAERHAAHDAQTALLAFAQAHARLPCPDTNGNGLEGGASGCVATDVVGTFPWRTVGVFAPAVRDMRYGVYRAPDAAAAHADVDLAVAKDRYRPLVVTGSPPAGNDVLLGNSNLLDFCFALQTGGRDMAVHADRLRVASDAAGANVRHMAFVLVAPGLLDADGNGRKLDGLNAAATAANPLFDHGARPLSESYDDQVLAEGFDTLFAELGCGKALGATGHAHFNAAAASRFMEQAFIDYKRQLKLLSDAAGASVASATAGTLMASSGLAKAIAASLNVTSVILVSQGSLSAIAAAAVAAIIANTAATVTSVASLATAIAFKVEADGRETAFAPMVGEMATIAASVDGNARAADAAGY